MEIIFWFAIILAILFFLNHFKIRDLKKKIVGAALIAIGIDMIMPPYPTTDTPLFLIYLWSKGIVQVPPTSEIPTLYAEYIPIVLIAGFIVIAVGIIISGYSPKKVLNKIRRGD